MMATKQNVISVFDFEDYRIFLKAYVQLKKNENPRWTFGVWARQLGLKSTSSITKVIKGQRNPGIEITERLIRHFEFKSDQAEYFRHLVYRSKLQGRQEDFGQPTTA